MRDNRIDEGATTEARVVVVNRSNDVVPTPIAIIGIPGGLEVRHDQLKELVKSGKISAYEVLGREVVLYWRARQGSSGRFVVKPGRRGARQIHRPRQPCLLVLYRRAQAVG